jgi:hypothetical protein
MLEITPSPEFSAWFESLEEPLAEQVAAALELVARAVGLLSPAQVSSSLLWFDGQGDGLPLDAGPLRMRFATHALHSYDRARELMLWRKEIVRCLESTVFAERLVALEPEAARLALTAVERVKQLLQAVRTQIGLAPANAQASPVFGVLSAHEERALRARFGIGPFEPGLLEELAQAFRHTLRLVGLDPGRLIGQGSGLRELTIDQCAPRLRVLFGLDAPGGRLVVLLGEALDRRYYGDSVRFAEERWAHYCADARGEVDPNSPRP